MLCKDLGIDDPICWFNAAPPAVIDAWLAYYTIEQEVSSGERQGMDPMTALKHLEKNHG